MDVMTDYRVNQTNNGTLISIEVTCCGKHRGEMRFKNGAGITCPECGTIHTLKIQHNHFHLRRQKKQEAE